MATIASASGALKAAPRFLRPTQLVQRGLVSSSSLYFSLRASSSINNSSSRNSGSGEKLRAGRKGWSVSEKKHKASLVDDTASGFNFTSFSMDAGGTHGAALPPPQSGITRVTLSKEGRQPQLGRLRPSTSSTDLLSSKKRGQRVSTGKQEENDTLERKTKGKDNKTAVREEEEEGEAEEEAEAEMGDDMRVIQDSGILNYNPTPLPNNYADVHRGHHYNTVEEKDESDSTDNGLGSVTTLSNPFRGIHEYITRSYRLDQLLSVSRPEDVMLGRQDTKSGAFSFIRFETGPRFLEDSRQSESTAATPPGRGKGMRGNANLSPGVASKDCALTVAERLLAFPPHLQHFHTICGRENVPCDFFADVDLPNETPASGEKILLDMLNYLEVRLQGVGFLQPSFLVLTNEVPSADKVSYHVHARAMGAVDNREEHMTKTEGDEMEGQSTSKKKNTNKKGEDQEIAEQKSNSKKKTKKDPAKKIIAFQDYRVVKLIADEVNATLGRMVVDEQCYRANGMLRCAYSMKVTTGQKGKRLLPLLKAQDPALQRRLNEITESLQNFTEADILERTFTTRFAPFVHQNTKKDKSGNSSNKMDDLRMYMRQFKFVRATHVLGPKDAAALEFDVYGNAVSAYLTEAAKWRRFKSVVDKLHRLPPRTAESYDVWVRIGLALHNFSNDDHVFDEWVRFSLKCPQKYSRESCRKKWQQFERNPDALNWRRGFNYLNSTVWRGVNGY